MFTNWRSVLALLCLWMLPAPLSVADEAKVTYADDVQPILRQHCFVCHNTDDANSDLALDSFESLMAGGASGQIVAAGDAGGSRLWHLINHEEEPAMPPGQEKLPEKQLAVIRAWIDGGLRKDAQSKAQPIKKSSIAAVEVTADNRPQGEPAMPADWWREPIVYTPSAGPVTTLAASPWAPLVAVPGQRQVSLFHAESGQLLGIAPYFEGQPQVVRFSRDGSLMLVGGGRGGALGKISLVDVRTGRQLASLGDELDLVLAADVTADRQLVALGGPRRVVRIFSTVDGKLVHEIRKHTDWVTALEFSPDGKSLVTADRAGGLHLWEAATARPLADLRGHKELVTSVSWRHDSQVIASAGEDGTVRLWQPDGKQAKNWQAHPGGTHCVSYARDGRLVTAGRDRHVAVWGGDGKNLAKLGPLPGETLSACFTHDGAHVVAGDFAGNVQVLAIEGGQTVATLAPNPPTLAMRIEQAQNELAHAEQAQQSTQQAAATAQQDLLAAQAQVADHAQQLSAAETDLRQLTREKEVADGELTELAAATKSAAELLAAATLRVDKAQQVVADIQRLISERGEVAKKDSADSAEQSADDAAAGESKANTAAAGEENLEQKLEEAQAELVAAQNARQAAEEQLAQARTSEQQQAKAAKASADAWQAATDRVAALRSEADQLPDLAALQEAADQARAARDEAIATSARAQTALDRALDEQLAYLALKQELANQSRTRLSTVEETSQLLESAEAARQVREEELARRQAATGQLADELAAIQARHAQALEEQAAAEKQVEEEAATKVAAAREAVQRAQDDLAAAAQLHAQFKSAETLRAEYAAKSASR